ncbi:MAG: glycerol-3-phosphate 1-O-acyltransferase PlsY [Oscillospiraceae bacterium]|nr:glycerol-3-phosphate 1-O-acyltransferase PlsY [Oscillospiraceae bacterium]
MIYVCIAFAIVVPYLLCSINPAIIVTKIKSGKDIRTLGSGNPGLTNTLRTQGKGAAVAVLLLDVFKGVASILAVTLFHGLLYDWEPMLGDYRAHAILTHGVIDEFFFTRHVALWIAALSAVLGHCFPVYYKFRGGKAVLVTISVLFCIEWRVALIALIVFILIVAITRYVSLGSCVGVAICTIYFWLYTTSYIAGSIMTIIAAIMLIKHRGNIKRLIAGNEKKLGRKDKVTE